MSKPYKSELLQEFIDSKDPVKVRGALTWVIQGDPLFKTNDLDHAIEYAESCGIKVFEDEKGFDSQLPINEDRGSWTERYFAEAVTYLQYNFTHERLEHVKKVSLATHQEMLSTQQPTVKAQHSNGDGKTQEVDPRKKAMGRRRKLLIVSILVLLAAVALLLFFQKK